MIITNSQIIAVLGTIKRFSQSTPNLKCDIDNKDDISGETNTQEKKGKIQ